VNKVLHDGENKRGRNAEHQHSIRRHERPKQAPSRRHNYIAITHRRVVCGRLVVRGGKGGKFAKDDEQSGPQSDFDQMSTERERCCARDEEDIYQEPTAGAADPFFMPNQGYSARNANA
jgi:hypothetical protein